MPDDSCRICGGELTTCSHCQKCRKAKQRACKACNSKTPEQFHENCIHLESTQTKTRRRLQIVTQVHLPQKKTNKSKKIVRLDHRLRNALLVFGIIGFFLLGFAGTNPFGSFQDQTNESQAMKTIMHKESQGINYISSQFYENCLAYGSGESLTVNCPTTYGYAYKALLSLPQDLASKFSSKVFYIRGISLNENVDGSVVLQYEKNLYNTRFFGS